MRRTDAARIFAMLPVDRWLARLAPSRISCRSAGAAPTPIGLAWTSGSMRVVGSRGSPRSATRSRSPHEARRVPLQIRGVHARASSCVRVLLTQRAACVSFRWCEASSGSGQAKDDERPRGLVEQRMAPGSGRSQPTSGAMQVRKATPGFGRRLFAVLRSRRFGRSLCPSADPAQAVRCRRRYPDSEVMLRRFDGCLSEGALRTASVGGDPAEGLPARERNSPAGRPERFLGDRSPARVVRAPLAVACGALGLATFASAQGVCDADVSGDGVAGAADIAAVLSLWGWTCQHFRRRRCLRSSLILR